MSRRNMSQKVVCRPCKEENNWEVVEPNGHVQKQHYQSKTEAVRNARQYANEFGYELVVEEQPQKNSSNNG